MPPTTIENRILNSPFEEPTRHFRFAEDGITDEIIEARRLAIVLIVRPGPECRDRRTAEIDAILEAYGSRLSWGWLLQRQAGAA